MDLTRVWPTPQGVVARPRQNVFDGQTNRQTEQVIVVCTQIKIATIIWVKRQYLAIHKNIRWVSEPTQKAYILTRYFHIWSSIDSHYMYHKFSQTAQITNLSFSKCVRYLVESRARPKRTRHRACLTRHAINRPRLPNDPWYVQFTFDLMSRWVTK